MIKKFVVMFVFLMAMAACQPSPETVAPPGPDQIGTQIAQTVQAELTAVAQLALTSENQEPPTAEPLATATLESQATATSAPLATATPDEPTSTPTALHSPTPLVPCNLVEFVGHVNVIPESSFTPGTDFIKTWRVRNIGGCTWNSDYALVFSSGERMDSRASTPLNREVRPGETIDLSVNLEAPVKTGVYTGNWIMRNAFGDTFGIGRDGKATLETKIQVSELDEVVLDFLDDACTAVWVNDIEEVLPCPGTDGDPAGFVLQVATPTLENGILENESALVVHPRVAEDGNIRGRFPEFQVKAGDHF